MRDDRTKSQVRSDNLILRFGSYQLRKLGPRSHNDITARMRMFGSLRHRIKSLNQLANCQLNDMLCGKGFDKVVDAIECKGQAYIDESR